jgi:hypothetical protein
MASNPHSPDRGASDSVPMPALLVERAIALARAEAGLALVHTRRIVVRAVSALLGTIVGCAFAQLTLLLLVAWPVLAARVPLVNLLFGVLTSGALAAGGVAFAVWAWAGVARERKASAPALRVTPSATPASSSVVQSGASTSSAVRSAVRSPGPGPLENAKSEPARSVNLAERVSL